MKTGKIKSKHKETPCVKTLKLTISAKCTGPDITSFTVTHAGQNPKVFAVKGGNVNAAWKRVQAYSKMK